MNDTEKAAIRMRLDELARHVVHREFNEPKHSMDPRVIEAWQKSLEADISGTADELEFREYYDRECERLRAKWRADRYAIQHPKVSLEEEMAKIEKRLQKVEFERKLGKVDQKLGSDDFVMDIFSRNTPVSTLRSLVRDKEIGFDSDERSDRKAYMFACFSELAYLQYTKFDLPSNDRYKVVPSDTLVEMRSHGYQIDLERVGARTEAMAGTVIDPGRQFLYAVFRTPYFTVIAVRGTVLLSRDVFLDLNFLKEDFNGYGYHRGFYKEANQALPAIKTVVGPDSTFPIYLTGHSLGAAVAVILRQIWGDTHKLMTPYVYATPRVGDEKVAGLGPVYSYIRPNDIVPRLAPRSLGFSDIEGQETLNQDEALDAEWKILAKFWALRHNHSIETYRTELGEKTKDDHFSPSVYIDALRATMIDMYRTLGIAPTLGI